MTHAVDTINPEVYYHLSKPSTSRRSLEAVCETYGKEDEELLVPDIPQRSGFMDEKKWQDGE